MKADYSLVFKLAQYRPVTHLLKGSSRQTPNLKTQQLKETFGDKACHPEHSEGSGSPDEEILRCAQDDSQDPSHVRSREASLQMSTTQNDQLTAPVFSSTIILNLR